MSDHDRIRTGLSFDDLLLVPQRTTLRSRRDVDTSTTLSAPVPITLHIPIASANTQWCTGSRMALAMALHGGLGFVHRMQTVGQQVQQVAEVKGATVPATAVVPTLDTDGRPVVGAAIGVTGDHLDRATALVAAGVDMILVDVAHGHADYVLETVEKLRASFPALTLVAGNVATAAGVRDLAEAGANIVKVGIGPGGVCTTRLVAGSGVPQMTAIWDCSAEAAQHGVSIIGDGGIRRAGDVAKAVAAGADAVMLGSALAGSDESDADLIERDGERYRASRGFATLGMANVLRLAAGERISREEADDYVAEGVEVTFPATGPVSGTLRQLVGGLQSAMSYSGARTVREFQDKAEFIRVTTAGTAENAPHALDRAPRPAPDHRTNLASS